MKITNIEAWKVEIKLKEPYQIAYDTIETAVNVFLRIETDRKTIGYGCAAPDEQVTGETATSVLNMINNIVHPMLKGADPIRIAFLIGRLKNEMATQYAALAAVDMALHDILGKVCNLPLWKLLGGFRERIMTSVTIGILTEDETIKKAKYWVAQGFNSLKLKGGIDVESDIARIIRVREAIGNEVKLCFDANQGYDVEGALNFLEQTRLVNLEFIEQPTPKNRPDLLGAIRMRSKIPVMADESLITLQDMHVFASNHLVDLVNIKLMKVGGISAAMQMIAVARAAGIKVMTGCMDEAELAIAAGLHLALSSSNIDLADLDGHLDLLDDPSKGSVGLRDGYIFPNDQPGLGWNRIEKN